MKPQHNVEKNGRRGLDDAHARYYVWTKTAVPRQSEDCHHGFV